MIFNGDDITVDHTELHFSTQLKTFTDVNYNNVDPIICKEVENVFSKLNDASPGLDMIKKSDMLKKG